MRQINEIIIHCSATPEGRDVTASTIRKWHKDRGWKDIGYHWIVYRNGKVVKGRPEEQIGAHCRGHNAHSIGICYIGGMDKKMEKAKDTRTAAQKTALVQLIRELKMRYHGIEKVSGHNQYANKACPSFNAQIEYENVFHTPEVPPIPDVPLPSKPSPVTDVVEDAAKSPLKSKTNWLTAISGGLTAAVAAFGNLDWRVQLALIVAACAAGFALYRLHWKRTTARKAQILL